jgi:hypothetical protein
MNQDDDKPPRAGAGGERRRGSLLRAVLTGAAIEIGGTLGVGIVLGIGYGLLLGAQGYSEEAMKEALAHPDPFSAFGILGFVLGSLVSVFAGYACAAIAYRPDYRPVWILASISVTLGLLLGSDAYSASTSVLLSALTIGCVLFGGWLNQKDLPR